ncbi:hypothetical protein [uncultured Massilia sp.]|uniref:hypothetical protein n=1 Tax=uncultured Massilia sp. TaxID=169973 RepID=UPI0025E6EA2D|nr:hypothetical protein [uncultured Massilia sp.]
MMFRLPTSRRPRRAGLLATALAASLFLLAGCGAGSDDDGAATGTGTRAKLAAQVSTVTGAALTLPLEVLGNGAPDKPAIAEAALTLASAKRAAAAQLWFQCHRCGFYGAPEFEATTRPPTKIKASVRVLGGASGSTSAASVPWIDITDANVQLADDERIHGGVNGGMYTTRITLNLDAATRARLVALPRKNLVQFRFNGTDGESNGFRILDVQLRDAAATRVDDTTVRRADPLADRALTASSADVAAGKALWYAQGRIAKSSIVTRKMQAACASCHSEDARDLQYFNYSNNAIVQRSLFHGLSATQGRQIAAFVRTSLRDLPYAANARPWNPPYQPGPGLDAHPAAWAGGAGLAAVLATPAQGVNALFGKAPDDSAAITQADVDRTMDPHATMNVREMPVPLQFPDWNAWLPTIHPLDVWPTQADGSGFVNGARFDNGDTMTPNGRYLGAAAWLAAHRNPNGQPGDWSHLTPDERVQINAMFNQWGWNAYTFFGGGRGNHVGAGGARTGAQVGAARLQSLAAAATVAAGKPGAFTTNAFIERAVASMLHWNAVKQWELAQRFQLEGNQTWFIGDKDEATGSWKGRGEAHGWPFNTVSTFYLAPHMVYQEDKDASGRIVREWVTAWETDNITSSYYRSNQWYQLQMTINAGGQSGWVNFPMDWPYLTAFDDYLGQRVGDQTAATRAAQQTHYLRLLQARIKSAQYVDNAIPLWDPTQAPGAPLYDNRARYGRAQVVKHLGVFNFLDYANRDGVGRSKYAFLDEVQPGLYLKMVNGAISQFTKLYAGYPADAWRRCDPSNTSLGEPEDIAGFRFCLDAAKTPLGTYADGTHFMVSNALYQSTSEQAEQYGLWQAQRIGADPARLQVWKDWTDRIWP